MFNWLRNLYRETLEEVLAEDKKKNKTSDAEQVKRLKEEIEELKLKKRLEEEEIKHLVKMKEEKNLIEAQKKEIELTKTFNQREMDLQKSYHEKVLESIETQRKESKDLYQKIMERLPNVNVEVKR